ncbi:MAG: hypothetical protein KUG83_00520 [Gammaproteobacteria bacterium]|nr:hypothetical protein [Gammaproteobacteria bacterium]
MRRSIYVLPLCALISLVGCGGGDGGGGGGVTSYGGTRTQASLSTDTSEQLARSATEGAAEATTGSELSSFPSAFGSSTNYEYVDEAVKAVLPGALETLSGSGLPSAFQEEQACAVSGSMVIAADDSLANNIDPNSGLDAEQAFPESGTIELEFRDCREEAGTTIDGLATITFTGGGGFTTVYQNLTVAYTELDGTQVVETIESLTIACTDVQTCSVQADFAGLDGRTYRISDVEVTGSDSIGWDVTATVYDPDLGFVEIATTTSLMFDCPAGVPSTGALTVTGVDSVAASVTYLSCSEFQVCLLEGNICSTYSW